jgi:hypothetical protein
VAFDLNYNGFVIHRSQSTGFVCLTDMWKAQGEPASKRPVDWRELDATQELLASYADQSASTALWSADGKIRAVPGILEAVRGGSAPGTYAIPELAIDYAQILSVDFHRWALTALVERLEEETDPEKALSRGHDRAVRGWKNQGYSDEDIDVLTQAVLTRKDLTGTLKAHGVADNRPSWVKNEHMAYAVVTNDLYRPLLPGTAGDYRKRNKLPPKANVREHLTQTGEITKRAAIMLAETMAREAIREEKRYGFQPCREACGQAGKKVSRVFEP